MTPLFGSKTPPEVKRWTLEKYASRLAYLDDMARGPRIPARPVQRRRRLSCDRAQLDRATPEIDLANYPNVKAYLERMRARPSVAAALALEVPLFQAEIARRKAA